MFKGKANQTVKFVFIPRRSSILYTGTCIIWYFGAVIILCYKIEKSAEKRCETLLFT